MAWLNRLSTKQKVLLGLGIYFGITIALLLLFGNQGKNDEFKPQDEFKLHDWIPIHIAGINFSINRAVLYLLLASALTIFVMVSIARRMEMKPNRIQTAVEVAYDTTKNNITGGNLSGSYATKWFPFIATLFFFIAFSNILGYLPLPTNTRGDDQHLRAGDPVVRDIRGDGEHLVLAGPHARRLVQLPHRGNQGQGSLQIPRQLPSGRASRT